ncbi:MAG: type II toxin-antitoxin system HicB family antitoxin [Chloroflexia bacterium]|nr:type II toxin-antitoxin system HicB family antitoxin [Chloroflexia bacterium]
MEHLTAVFERDGDWWIGSVEEIPGAHTQGRTLDEARGNLADAAREIIAANREVARQQSEGREVIREPLELAGA